ncbi:MAG: hypothetical protein ABIH00_01375 [Armatimonadota bacterium]
MKFIYTRQFVKEYKRLPQNIQNKFKEKIKLMEKDFSHPSLRIKKLNIKIKNIEIWAGSLTMNYRFLFNIYEDYCTFMHIGTHDILDK